ncbi:hypothetical protein [Streptomyces olivoreticuli]|uniref:hypothetical protein n=1 Tax=Streptomyces olivoreticuli TaxID=68246 RepID=UPI000E26382C|nr:hypothetical protein [Streptomyces olivoreticuli]
MPSYKPLDRVSALYRSTTHGTALALGQRVEKVEPHERHGQRVWVSMPDDAAEPLADYYADSDRIEHMEADPIGQQSAGHLYINLVWFLKVAANDSTSPRLVNGQRVEVPYTSRERADAAARAALYISALRHANPRLFSRWEASEIETARP